MTDKEMMGKIIESWNFGKEILDHPPKVFEVEEIDWLINQAERALKNAQDLEDMDKQLAGEQKRVRELEEELKETITKKNRHLREKDKKIKKLEWKAMIHERSHSDTYSRLFERNEECKLLKEKTERYEKALRKIAYEDIAGWSSRDVLGKVVDIAIEALKEEEK